MEFFFSDLTLKTVFVNNRCKRCSVWIRIRRVRIRIRKIPMKSYGSGTILKALLHTCWVSFHNGGLTAGRSCGSYGRMVRVTALH
jgi:hypothetical protein